MNNFYEQKTNYPPGWKVSSLDDSCEILLGQSPPSSTYNTLKIGLPFFQGKTEFGSVSPTPAKWCSKPIKISLPKDILISVRAPVGPTNICIEKCCIGRGLAAIRAKEELNYKFLFYYLRYIENSWSEKATGTTFKAISGNTIRKQLIPLPALDEQIRIVEYIEKLFTQLDAGMVGLKRVQAALKRYRASVLKAACEGRLASQDQITVALEKEPGNQQQINDFNKLSITEKEIPKGWRWTTLSQIAEIIGGITKGRNFREAKTVFLPYLRVANVQRGYLNLNEMKEIELKQDELEKYRLIEEDIVFTEGGDWDKLGRAAIWDNHIPVCVHQNHIFRARITTEEVLPKWIMYYTNSVYGQDYFKSAAKQTTNLASINLSQLKSFPILIPPFDEQEKIITNIENNLIIADKVEQSIIEAINQGNHLKMSILTKAFEGRILQT